MSDTLRQWRTVEGIPTTYVEGEPSRAVPLTGEPVERTIPTMVARIARQEHRIFSCMVDVEEVSMVRDRVQLIEEERHLDNQALGTMHHRIQQLEQRIEEMSIRTDSAEHWGAVANQRAINAQEQAEAAGERADSATALAVVCLSIASAAVQTSALSRRAR